jgi:hypothetical protein
MGQKIPTAKAMATYSANAVPIHIAQQNSPKAIDKAISMSIREDTACRARVTIAMGSFTYFLR